MSEDTMRRTPGVNYEPSTEANVLDFVADYAHDAIDAGVPEDAVVRALEEAAEEIEAEYQDTDGRPEPRRSEPADFGGGETTGVQDL